LSDIGGARAPVRCLHGFNLQPAIDMRKIKFLTTAASVALFAGLVALLMAAGPEAALFGKFVIAVAALGFAGIVLGYLMQQAQEALTMRNEQSHWH
jgi:hypothetical protein